MKTKINNQIKESHECAKKRGDWDGLPYPQQGICIEAAHEAERYAYIAGKLDLITEPLVDAMRVRREGKIGDTNEFMEEKELIDHYDPPESDQWDESITDIYEILILGSFPFHLALAYTRTLDLMGFHDDTYKNFNELNELVPGSADLLLRELINGVSGDSVRALRGFKNYIQWANSGSVWYILRIAELDGIDLDWHYEALMKYMEVK